MANFYQQISGGINARQEQLRKIQQEKDALAKQKAMEGQRQNILQQYFQPAVPERQEVEAVSNPLAQFMGDQPQQQYQNLVAATPKPVNNLVERQTNVQPQGSVIPETQMKTIPGKEAVFDPRGAMGALFGVGDIETGKQMQALTEGTNAEKYGTGGDLIRLPDGSIVRRQYSAAGTSRDIPIDGEIYTPTTSYQESQLTQQERETRLREQEAKRRSDAENERLSIQREELNLKKTAAGKTPSAPATSEGERQAAGFLGRMGQSSSVIDRLEAGNIGLPTEKTSIAGALGGDYIQRKVMTKEQQQYKNAADAWIRAKLRKESGAVIGEDESKAEYRTYFPVPGDGPEVIAQKAANRKEAEQEMRISAGRALGQASAPPEQKAAPKEVDLLPRNAKEGSIARDATTGKPAWVVKNGKWVRYK